MFKTSTGTKHKADCNRVFKNYDKSCQRCLELSNGAAPRKAWGWHNKANAKQEARWLREHDCHKSNCMSICTNGDW